MNLSTQSPNSSNLFMNHRIKVSLLWLVLVLLLSGCGPAAPQGKEPSVEIEQFIMQRIENKDTNKRVASLSLGIIEDYQLKVHKTYGFSKIEEPATKASNQNIYLLASCSKPIVGLAAAILKQKLGDKLDMNADINDYLAWDFKLVHPFFKDTPITLNHLLAHTSGVVKDAEFDYSTYSKHPNPDPADGAMEKFLQERLNQEKFWQKEKEPGQEFSYTNLGVALAALVIEKVAIQQDVIDGQQGENFRTFCQKEIFTPLEMEDTKWFYKSFTEGQQDQIVTPYDIGLEPLKHYGFLDWPSGMLRSNVSDMSKLFIQIMKDGQQESNNRIFPKATIDLFHGTETKKPMLIEKGKEGDVFAFEHAGAEAGAITYFVYTEDGSGWIYLLNTTMDDKTSKSFADQFQPLLKKEIELLRNP